MFRNTLTWKQISEPCLWPIYTQLPCHDTQQQHRLHAASTSHPGPRRRNAAPRSLHAAPRCLHAAVLSLPAAVTQPPRRRNAASAQPLRRYTQPLRMPSSRRPYAASTQPPRCHNAASTPPPRRWGFGEKRWGLEKIVGLEKVGWGEGDKRRGVGER